MKQYELMVIVDPDIGTDAINAKLEEIRKLIASQKGEVFFEDLWGMRDLAYRIKKKDRGFYAVLDLNMESTGLKEINTTLKIDNEVLRHMLVSLPVGYEPKSLIEIEKVLEAKDAEVAAKKNEGKPAAPVAPVRREEKKESRPVVKVEKKEEVKEIKKVEEKESPKATLEDVDKKLSNLLDNPDLNF